ncbi:MAG: D-alanyl-D-alanine carboxypeptidase [Oscillospiraceae bacterium]|nr:D-alanyl-D-alanine carboxypeptidase [Oscillospiraceae bacterium]
MKKIICVVMAAVTVMLLGFPRARAVETLSVSAKSAIVIDAQTGAVIYAKSENTHLPMASTTKIMTTLLLIESGDLDTEFVVDDEALLTEGSSMYLRSGDMVTKRELCYGMMLPSGNDAANASALKLAGDYEGFAAMMNKRANSIGMMNTSFVTPSGLHDENHYSTAYDMSLLAREAMKNELFREICSTQSIRLSSENWSADKYLSNTNRLLNKYEYCIGIKTGFTDEAGRCLVSAAEKDGVTLIAVTLNAPDDWNDHIKMYEYGFKAAQKQPIDGASDSLEAEVVGGDSDRVKCRLAEAPMCTAVNGVMPEITEEIHMKEFSYAPVLSGDKLGYAEYSIGGEVIAEVDIVADEDCAYRFAEAEISLYNKLIDWLKGFFKG